MDGMLELIQKTVYDVSGKRGVTMDTDFVADLGLNSFDIMNIIAAFEDRFHTEVPARDVWKLSRVRDVIAYMKKRGYTV